MSYNDYWCRPNILFHACGNNQIDIIKECIRNGYDINAQNFWFQTPLIIASQNNNLDAVKTIVENGADLNIIDIYGSTALGHANDQSEVQTHLRSKNAKYLKNSTEGITNLILEIQNKQTPSQTTKEIINKADLWGFSPFMWAIWHRSKNHFKHYLALGADVNQKCRNGTTPLILACFRYNFDMVQLLIEKGASVNHIDDNGNSALIYCVINWIFDINIADLLIDKGADINQSGVNQPTPLIAATIYDDSSAFTYFLNKKAKVNETDNTGNTALAYASYWEDIDYVKILIENKADLDLCGPKGKTPLSWAATTNNLEIVKLLLTKGAKINYTDPQHNTALSYAKQYKNDAIIKYLQDNGATENEQPKTRSNKIKETTPLLSAIQRNDFESVKSLIENGEDPCEVDDNGNTPLMVATRTKNQEVVKYLLENEADLTVHSALPTAIEIDDLDILKILIQKGANVNMHYRSTNQTPLVQAVTLKNLKMVQFLVENGADPNLTGNLLRTAIELKCHSIVKYLIGNGIDVNEACQNQPSLLKLAIQQKNLRLIVLLVKQKVNLKDDLDDLEQFSRENDDFRDFFNKNIASKFKANKFEVEKQ